MKLSVFYHMFCEGHFLQLFEEAYAALEHGNVVSACAAVYVNAVGAEAALASERLASLPKVRLRHGGSDDSGEVESINLVHQHAMSHDGAVLYVHSKGVTKPGDYRVSAWADMMLHFCALKASECVSLLETYDTVGTNLAWNPCLHYSGNYWWARTSYVRRLNLCIARPQYNFPARHAAEFWLLGNSESKRAYSMHNSNIDHYREHYPAERYAAHAKQRLVKKATYGTDTATVDVTPTLQTYEGSGERIIVGNSLFGDVHFGTPKILTVQFEDGITRTYKESEATLDFSRHGKGIRKTG